MLELLLSMLALTEPIGSLTNELRALDKHRTLVCHPTRAQTVNGPSIQRTIGLSRTLKDEALALQVYERQQLREKRYESDPRHAASLVTHTLSHSLLLSRTLSLSLALVHSCAYFYALARGLVWFTGAQTPKSNLLIRPRDLAYAS